MSKINDIVKHIKIMCKNGAEENAIKNALLAKTVCVAGLKNLKFDSEFNIFNESVFSHYAVNFMPSGSHKGNISNALDFLFPFLQDDINRINYKIKEDYINDELDLLSGKEKERYRKKIINDAERQEVLTPCVADASPEGLYESANLISRIKKGFLFIKNAEFSSYYSQSVYNLSSNNALFLNCLYDLWDGVFSSARKIKGYTRKELKNITTSVLFMSTFTKMNVLEVKKAYKNDLSTGSARRFLFVYDYTKNYYLNPPIEPDEDEIQVATIVLGNFKKEYADKYNAIKPDTIYHVNKTATSSIKDFYNKFCFPEIQKIARKSNSINNEILLTYLHNCKWTITKLLAVYSLFENPLEIEIDNTYLDEVLAFWKQSYYSLTDIINSRQQTDVDLLVNCFIDNQNKELMKNDIMSICEINPHSFKSVFSGNIDEVKSILADKGFELKELSKRKNTHRYLCRPIQKAENTIKLSYSDDLTSNYKFVDLTVDELKELIKSNCNFVAGELKDGYRKDENYIGNQKTIWLDFDDGTTLTEAKEMFKDYWYLIYTSRNHQKVKGKKPACDRFRVILQTEQPIPADKYEVIMDNIIKEFNADSACKNKSRLYYGNADAQIFTNDGAYFDWSSYNIEPKKVQLVEQKAEYKGDNVGLTDETIDTDYGDKILKTEDIIDGNRDNALAYSVGVLIEAVNKGNLSHHVALNWFDSIAWNISTPDFKENIKKFRKRLEELKF